MDLDDRNLHAKGFNAVGLESLGRRPSTVSAFVHNLMRILIASIVLLVVNASRLVPGLEEVHSWIPLISMAIAVYLLIQAVFLLQRGPAKRRPSAEPAPTVAQAPAVSEEERHREIDAHVVHFLGLLQEKGRLVDFVMDDITSYNNEQVGAAARVVHQGCAQVVREHLGIAPVHSGPEGAPVTLESGYDPLRYRAIGKLVGSPPFQGTLLHHGWKANKIQLPRLAEKPSAEADLVIAPAEVEVKQTS
jgi:hypothetical protein